jgi:hypothetical protein
LPARRAQPSETPPDLPPERAFAVLSAQLKSLQALKGRNYSEAEAAEDEWRQLTEKLVIRSFGSGSPNVRNFRMATSAGEQFMVPYGAGVSHELYQSNFGARVQSYESVLNSCLAELRIDLPEDDIKGVYEPGQEYEFYRDIKSLLAFASKEIFIVDPYLSVELFDVYASAIPRTVLFRLLSAAIPPDVRALAQKYASGGNLEFRSSPSIHDRVIFADARVWLCGQSLKDAAKKKPTYIVEHDEPAMRRVYEDLWQTASAVL